MCYGRMLLKVGEKRLCVAKRKFSVCELTIFLFTPTPPHPNPSVLFVIPINQVAVIAVDDRAVYRVQMTDKLSHQKRVWQIQKTIGTEFYVTNTYIIGLIVVYMKYI